MCSFTQLRSTKKGVERRSVSDHERSRKDVIKGLSRCIQIHKLKVNEVSIEELLSWVRSARVFKKIVGKNKSQDVRNTLNAKVN